MSTEIPTKQLINTEMAMLRIDLEDGLTPFDLQKLLYSVSTLYNILIFQNSLWQSRYDLPNKNGGWERGFEVTVIASISPGIQSTSSRGYFLLEELTQIKSEQINRIAQTLPAHLLLRRINYNSPGSIDITGLGTALKTAKDLYIENKRLNHEIKKDNAEEIRLKNEEERKQEGWEQQKLMNEILLEKQKQELLEMKLKNAQAFVNLKHNILLGGLELQKEVVVACEDIKLLEDKHLIGELKIIEDK